jgi:hypothetical protein
METKSICVQKQKKGVEKTDNWDSTGSTQPKSKKHAKMVTHGFSFLLLTTCHALDRETVHLLVSVRERKTAGEPPGPLLGTRHRACRPDCTGLAVPSFGFLFLFCDSGHRNRCRRRRLCDEQEGVEAPSETGWKSRMQEMRNRFSSQLMAKVFSNLLENPRRRQSKESKL